MKLPGSDRTLYRGFVDLCSASTTEYRLTPCADPTPYATCFAVFGLHLLKEVSTLTNIGTSAARELKAKVRAARGRTSEPATDKPYRQLLAFTLSALRALGVIEDDPLEQLVLEQLRYDLDFSLRDSGSLLGRPQSGNQAMFTAVFLLHAGRYLGKDTSEAIDRWVELHLQSMNRFGFWGSDRGMTHLAFQNGYHQYEIFEYLGIRSPRREEAIASVRGLADDEGHFAPYPGGGGCYDYDAVFMLTPEGRRVDERTADVLQRLRQAILNEQTAEGGFAESHRIRPRSLENVRRAGAHAVKAWGNWPLFAERLRQAVTLQRPKHDRIHTHWSGYSRRWNEANLWDSWFRMLTVARIEVALDLAKATDWGFIDYPGIGFHPAARQRALVTA
jgi:hypothetical protein